MVPQDVTEAVLLDKLRALGSDVLRPFGVVGIDSDDDGVLVTATDAAGARAVPSRYRRWCGARGSGYSSTAPPMISTRPDRYARRGPKIDPSDPAIGAATAVGRDVAEIEFSTALPKLDLGTAEALADDGFSLLTVGVWDPDYDHDTLAEAIRWRDQRNAAADHG